MNASAAIAAVAKAKPDHVLHFWFETLRPEDWYRSDEGLDDFVREKMGALHDLAEQGALEHWQETPEGALALIILLDQVPRNIHRNTTRAFASDDKARAVLAAALEGGLDKRLTRRKQVFMYLPLMHCEDMAGQEQSVRLFTALGKERNLDYAIRHRDVIRRYGRFPHRNAILGRESTALEQEYLDQPGAGF